MALFKNYGNILNGEYLPLKSYFLRRFLKTKAKSTITNARLTNPRIIDNNKKRVSKRGFVETVYSMRDKTNSIINKIKFLKTR